ATALGSAVFFAAGFLAAVFFGAAAPFSAGFLAADLVFAAVLVAMLNWDLWWYWLWLRGAKQIWTPV
ncbi:MAG: hypothetical protein PF961_00745, partial [Planctomycetota bacterium]|nr:hypothetical protein [Planctomycetota bacterium]